MKTKFTALSLILLNAALSVAMLPVAGFAEEALTNPDLCICTQTTIVDGQTICISPVCMGAEVSNAPANILAPSDSEVSAAPAPGATPVDCYQTPRPPSCGATCAGTDPHCNPNAKPSTWSGIKALYRPHAGN